MDQRSIYDQLKDLRTIANGAGMYDAADFLTQHIARIENREQDAERARAYLAELEAELLAESKIVLG